MLGFPVVPNMSVTRRGKPRRMRLKQVQFIGFVLLFSCVKCYITFLKRLKNVLNSNINGKYALPVDRKDIKVCSGDKKSKSSDITVKRLYSVFLKLSLLTCDSIRYNKSQILTILILIKLIVNAVEAVEHFAGNNDNGNHAF